MSLLKAQFCDKIWKERKRNSLSTKFPFHKNHPKIPISFSHIMNHETELQNIPKWKGPPEVLSFPTLICKPYQILSEDSRPVHCSYLVHTPSFMAWLCLQPSQTDPPPCSLLFLLPTHSLKRASLWKFSNFWSFFSQNSHKLERENACNQIIWRGNNNK